jgi:gamma-butyrobetaine dioxygenase
VTGTDRGDLELIAGGRRLRFPAVWLRDNCPCAQCTDPRSGQKFSAITDLPDDLAVAAAEDAGESVVVTYGPDRHRSVFSRAWLTGHALDGHGDGDGRTEDDKVLWMAADLPGLPEASWPHYLAEPAERVRGLDAVLRLGFVLLRDVPAEPGLVREVAASFGYVRETNYGRLFDVRVEPAPGNLAYTSRAILPHTDNPYRDPVPTVQLLHCLRAAGDGGDTGLVDGFAAARYLRDRDREAFGVLTGTAVSFGYRDNGTELRASQPLIQLGPRGRIRGVRFNNRSARPLRLPYDEVTAFYAAYRRWADLLAEPERQVRLRLSPGDCLIFDNTRILHARTAFSLPAGGSAGRHLQGCYADLDGLASTLAILGRPAGVSPPRTRRNHDGGRDHRRALRRAGRARLPGRAGDHRHAYAAGRSAGRGGRSGPLAGGRGPAARRRPPAQ